MRSFQEGEHNDEFHLGLVAFKLVMHHSRGNMQWEVSFVSLTRRVQAWRCRCGLDEHKDCKESTGDNPDTVGRLRRKS